MTEKNNDDALESVTEGVEIFTTDFHKCLAGKKSSGNFVSSALSAHTVLSMAAYGADGATARAMRATLRLPKDDSIAHKGFQSFVDTFNDVPKVVLKLSNKIYAAHDLAIKDNFKHITGTYFRSESEKVDFKKNVESAKMINSWCDKKTNGKIQEILSSDDINESVRMVLLNAVYFKGDWKEKFDSKFTERKPFHVDKATTVQVPTMHISKKFYFTELDEVDAKVIALPYVNEDLYMVIIVPNEIDGLANIEKNLEKINLNYRYFGHGREVHLSLPKFKIESTHDLKDHLMELGMGEMFTKKANFRNMCDENVFVSKVVQKAFIEVNEEGSEAAAVTGMQIMLMCVPLPPEELNVDRPFLFKIMHKNTTLFCGRVSNPLD